MTALTLASKNNGILIREDRFVSKMQIVAQTRMVGGTEARLKSRKAPYDAVSSTQGRNDRKEGAVRAVQTCPAVSSHVT